LRAAYSKMDIGLGALAPGLMPRRALGAIGGAFELRQVAKVEIATAERCDACALGPVAHHGGPRTRSAMSGCVRRGTRRKCYSGRSRMPR
jgi:hypothetical protein